MNNKDKIMEKIVHIIEQNCKENEHINFEKSFEQNGIGSLTFIKILVEIEEIYDIEIEERYYLNTEYTNLQNFVRKLTSYVVSTT